MSNITLWMSDSNFTLPAAAYTEPIPGYTTPSCLVSIQGSVYPYTTSTVLGAAFMRNYVITFDYSGDKSMTFAINVNAPTGVTAYFPPVEDGSSGLGAWIIVAIVAGCLLLVILAVFAINHFVQKRRNREDVVREEAGGEDAQLVSKADKKFAENKYI